MFRSPSDDCQVSVSVLHVTSQTPSASLSFDEFKAIFEVRKLAEQKELSPQAELSYVAPQKKGKDFIASISGADPTSGRRFDALLVGKAARIVVAYVETVHLSAAAHKVYVERVLSGLGVA